MPAIAATEQDVWPPRVQVAVTGLTLGNVVTVYRSVAGSRTVLRGGSLGAVTSTAELVIDAEQPFGVPVTYVADVAGVEYSTAADTYTLPGGLVALSDAITGQAAECMISAWPSRRRSRRHTAFDVDGRNIVVAGALGQYTADVSVITLTDTATEALETLLETATGSIVQVRQPGGYNRVDGYWSVIGWEETRWSQDGSDDRREHVLSVIAVDGWASALTARGYTYADLAAVYAGLTYANVKADYATYFDLRQADLSP